MLFGLCVKFQSINRDKGENYISRTMRHGTKDLMNFVTCYVIRVT